MTFEELKQSLQSASERNFKLQIVKAKKEKISLKTNIVGGTAKINQVVKGQINVQILACNDVIIELFVLIPPKFEKDSWSIRIQPTGLAFDSKYFRTYRALLAVAQKFIDEGKTQVGGDNAEKLR